jgi:hypothetical protein
MGWHQRVEDIERLGRRFEAAIVRRSCGKEAQMLIPLDLRLKAALRDDLAARSYLCDLHQQILNTRDPNVLPGLLGKYVALAAARAVSPLRSADMTIPPWFQPVVPPPPPVTTSTPPPTTSQTGGLSTLGGGPLSSGGAVVLQTYKVASGMIGQIP